MQNNSGSVTIQTLFDVESSEVCIVVKDQGEGLSAKAQKHLFEAFFSTKLDKGGSGLGLYISNYIVSEHGGHLTVKPAKDIGTVATVHLPLASDCSVS
jgi:signal transduction histidine kinase